MKRPRATPALPGSDDAALHARLAAMFRAEVGAQVSAVEDALARRDWPRVRAKVHYLKSSAGVIGDIPLYDKCGAVEDAAEQARGPRVKQAWAECLTALARWRGAE